MSMFRGVGAGGSLSADRISDLEEYVCGAASPPWNRNTDRGKGRTVNSGALAPATP